MKKILLIFVIVIIGVMFCSCSNTLTAETTEAVDADMIRIVLEENASSGYYWEYEISNEDVIEYVSDAVENDANNEISGNTVNHEWVFRGISEGEAIISFNYVSPNDEILNNIFYKYTVKDGVSILVDKYKNKEK